jgi:streptogramin lyase
MSTILNPVADGREPGPRRRVGGALHSRRLRPLAAAVTLLSLLLVPATPALASGPPVNTALPVITSHTPVVGLTISTSKGTWTESPTGFTYKFELCNGTGGACSQIATLGTSELFVAEAYENHTIRAKVTAKNASGSTSAISEPTALVPKAGTISEYSRFLGTDPTSIAPGSEGTMFYTEPEVSAGAQPPRIRKITPSGTISTVVSFAKGYEPREITAGLPGEHALWFISQHPGPGYATDLARVSESGVVTEFTIPAPLRVKAPVAYGGVIWTALGNEETGQFGLGESTTAGVLTPRYDAALEETPSQLSAGSTETGAGVYFLTPEGNLVGRHLGSEFINHTLAAGTDATAFTGGWFIDSDHNALDEFGASGGSIEEHAVPFTEFGAVEELAWVPNVGPWFAATKGNNLGEIGRWNRSKGTLAEYEAPGLGTHTPTHLAVGTDGYLWFTNEFTGVVGKIAP